MSVSYVLRHIGISPCLVSVLSHILEVFGLHFCLPGTLASPGFDKAFRETVECFRKRCLPRFGNVLRIEQDTEQQHQVDSLMSNQKRSFSIAKELGEVVRKNWTGF